MKRNNLLRMDNVGIVVESLDEVIAFFTELGLKVEGRGMIEGEWAGRVTGLGSQSVEVVMMVTPDGHSRLEISRFLTPPVIADHRLTDSSSEVDNSSVKWFSMRMCIDSATFAGLKDFSLAWQNNLAISKYRVLKNL